MNIRVIYFIALLLSPSLISAQTLGANRLGIEWQELKTPAANIIFAPELEYQAQRVADIVNYMQENNSLSIGPKKHKIDILIRNESIVPNAYVALGPFRSEFYATPPDNFNDIGATDWIDHLAIHEYRHVMQAANEKVGLTKLAYYITGESGWNGMKFLSIPQWVSEGDAVIMETFLTPSGRGRMPYFTRGLRALAQEGISFDYQKWSNGSYDELVPSRYPFGYMLLSHLRNTKGSELSGKIIRDGASYRKVFYPYSSAMKSETGWSTTALYQEAWKHYGEIWKDEIAQLELTPTTKLTSDPRVVTDYHFPQFTEDGRVIALKSSFNKTEHLVYVDGFRDSIITSIGFSYSDFFNYQKGKVTWTEYSQDARRFNTQYSDIFIMDLEDRKKKKITHKGRYFSPTISPYTGQVIAVFISPDQQNEIHVLDGETGEIHQNLFVPTGASVSRPSFVDRGIYTLDGQVFIYIIKKDNRIWIERQCGVSGEVFALTPKTGHVIDALATDGQYVYYSASYTGIDNIFRVPLEPPLHVEQVTSVPIGAYEPSISEDGKTLLFTEYTTRGQMISKMDLTDEGRKMNLIEIVEPSDMTWMDKVSAKEEGGDILGKLNSKKYQKEEYSGLFRGLKLHSWAFSPTSSELIGGLQFNNILDDASIFLGGGYNQNEDRGFYLANMKIARYYPVFEVQAETRGRASINFTDADTFAIQRYEELDLSTEVSIPFSWVSGNYFKRLEFGAAVVNRRLYNTRIQEVDLDNESIFTSNFFLRFSSLRRTAYQNVRPRLGYTFIGEYSRNLSYSKELKFIGTTRLYLPGLDYNHSFRLTLSYQKELAKNRYQYSDNFGYPRGYRAPLNDDVYKFGMDYMFPVAYPDIGFKGIAYFKRLRMNLFYDIGQFRYREADFSDNFQSIGADFYFDLNMYNLLPVSAVVRYSYRLSTNVIDTSRGGVWEFFSYINF